MAEQEAKPVSPTEPPILAVIDIGTNSIRMSIGQVLADGSVEVLERLQRAVHLGQDAFRFGRLERITIRAAISILREFKRRIDFYGARRIWTAATSALREARNADVFVDRVLMSTGLEVDILDPTEQGRLTVLAVREALKNDMSLMGCQTLITEVGGGSTMLTFLKNGQITASQGLGLGSIRLQEMLEPAGRNWMQTSEFIRREIESIVSPLESLMPLRSVKTFLTLGADARFAAEQIGTPLPNPSFRKISRARFRRFLEKLKNFSPEQLAQQYDLPYTEAETLVPALLIYQELLDATSAKEWIVSSVSMRDGLLVELSRRSSGRQEQVFRQEAVQSALALAEKYKVNLDHAQRVAACAVRLFDALKTEHGLSERHRLLLEIAALLHEIGMFVSARAYHKHSLYLILNSEIFGLSREEVQIVAHTARYHRRGTPKPTHVEYMSLSRENRLAVNKLAALLRLAKAMDLEETRQIEQMRIRLQDDTLTIEVPGLSEESLKTQSIGLGTDFFEDVYGLKILWTGGL
ncbi:MAG TPA: Ppx/GppA phosphatase family protein [Anaerohalosphaeraceae bacterium]|nr:Ppx/GppA phosphatase family protein [Anaerohalosphaeraceae bacterium]